MGFGDLQSRDSLLLLNTFLADKSYIEGYRPSQGDIVVFEAVKKAPSADLEHALRWYKHISSFNDAEKQKFEGQRQSIDHYGRHHGQDSQEKHEFKSLSVNPAEREAAKKAAAQPAAVADDDDVDLFGDEDEEESEQTKQRLAAYAEKKSKKPTIIAKSNIVLDIKPWDDETNMQELEKNVRSIEIDGLLWGASRLVPLAYTIKKLQITCVVEDDKVGTDILEEHIMAFEDHVQSVDIASFQKI
jgi:elongation factor 1-beta